MIDEIHELPSTAMYNNSLTIDTHALFLSLCISFYLAAEQDIYMIYSKIIVYGLKTEIAHGQPKLSSTNKFKIYEDITGNILIY